MLIKKKNRLFLLKLNTITAIVYQLINIIYGLVLPNLYLNYYGSEINGLVSSITQYLGMISFCELGVGAVVQSALYKPLAVNDEDSVSAIMSEAKSFFKKIALILCVYVIVLVVIYPLFINKSFGIITTTCLIVAVAINLFSQYYFGLSSQILLNADQKLYINYGVQILSTVLTAVIAALMIINGFSVEVVKLVTSIIFLLRPLLLWLYVRNNYHIKHVKSSNKHLTQKWNGMIHHIAYVVVEHTDVVVLTSFSTLTNVSIYYIYYMVASGVKQIVVYATSGVQSLLGNIMAVDDENHVEEVFSTVEWTFHFICTTLFTITGLLIIPFIRVYTRNITDANYIVPLFGVLLVCSQFFYCIRQPYYMAVKAAGDYKKTQWSAATEAVLNIVISIIFVSKLGLIGVAIGTITAMSYRTIYFVVYLTRNILNRSITYFVKQIVVDVIVVGCSCLVAVWIPLLKVTYFHWIILAIEVSFICFFVAIVVNFIFYRDRTRSVVISLPNKIKNRIKH
ncbi:lipopolysaccharide biosynthesis protein [Enterococcus dongliensis]|uniref:lipopolysaccharide biosynthesis protein n=1 Tax=Enterococcus dongliensis TaxID=2559925 RepID=UPI00289212CE|nr:polysaccharide biosynthesis C-terminal domain-containing protein [Enterococcus dongliensis]MDT2712388.1 polysaccharide biosynthesis C-terminal domain-containing protein [Enterococcus dongliensis]